MNRLRKCVYIHEEIVYIYTMEFYSSIKENETILFAGKWVELEIIVLNKISQIQKDNGYMFSLICEKKKIMCK
jgi:hypothetical protein